LIASVAENREFLEIVQKVTETLFNLLINSKFAEDDPQELSVKETLA